MEACLAPREGSTVINQPRSTQDKEALHALLTTWPVGLLAISRPGNTPWANPIVFAPHKGLIYSPIDGKTKTKRPLARLAHIFREGSATLLLDGYHEDWSELWWVRMSVDAAVLSPVPFDHPGLIALTAKYPQYQEIPVVGDPPTLIELTVRSLTSWTAAGNRPSKACGAGRRSSD